MEVLPKQLKITVSDGEVWLHFKPLKTKMSAGICLNNLANEKGNIVGNAMKAAISEIIEENKQK
jgi:hypothetical protein